MLYPAYVELGDESHAFAVVLPDFPGCFSAADKLEDLPDRVQEAVELYCEGEDMPLPQPSTIEELRQRPEFDYPGEWKEFDIDIDKLQIKKNIVKSDTKNKHKTNKDGVMIFNKDYLCIVQNSSVRCCMPPWSAALKQKFIKYVPNRMSYSESYTFGEKQITKKE